VLDPASYGPHFTLQQTKPLRDHRRLFDHLVGGGEDVDHLHGGRHEPQSVRSGPRRRCVMGEDKVATLGRLVAGPASLVQRLVARFAVLKVSKTPTARRRVLF